MRISFKAISLSIVLAAATVSAPSAAPVPGFEAFYDAALVACGPGGSIDACTAAINAYSNAMIAAQIDPAVALTSFTQLRTEVAAAGGSVEIAALFEQLLPASGSVATSASPV